LYQRFGFYPRFLTAIMRRVVDPNAAASGWSRYSAVPAGQRAGLLDRARALADAVHPALDLTHEIGTTADQGLGDTVLLEDGSDLAGIAVCHCGAGSEAGSGSCYVKFGAVRPGRGADTRFERLLGAVEALAATTALPFVVAGVNLAHEDAYRRMLARGFRTDIGCRDAPSERPCHHRPPPSSTTGAEARARRESGGCRFPTVLATVEARAANVDPRGGASP
jgi:hypothetical protein